MSKNSACVGDCFILPIRGRVVITHREPMALQELRLSSRPASWRFFVVLAFALGLWVTPTKTNAAVTVDELLTSTNSERTTAGVPPLTRSALLDAAATSKANDMIDQKYFSHTSPSGERAWVWMKKSGYAYTEAGENLAMDFTDSEDIVNAWMRSTGHRKNILGAHFEDVGVAAVTGDFHGQSTTMVVMLFGRQTSTASILSASATTVAPAPKKPVTLPCPTLPVTATTTKPIAETTIPSITAEARPIPQLTLTLVEPNPTYTQSATPRVLGLSAPVPPPSIIGLSSEIGWMILSALALAGLTLSFASIWWSQIYPQPLRPLLVSTT